MHVHVPLHTYIVHAIVSMVEVHSLGKTIHLGLMQYKSLLVSGVLFKLNNFLNNLSYTFRIANSTRSRQSGTHKSMTCPSIRQDYSLDLMQYNLSLLVIDVLILNCQLNP